MTLAFLRTLTLVAVIAISTLAQTFTEFKFAASEVGWNEDFVGIIDNENRTITFETQKWIENIANLRATYQLNNKSQTSINNILQTSDIIENDFRKDAFNTINGNVQYTVTIISPQTNGIQVVKIDTEDNTTINSKTTYINKKFFLESTFCLTIFNQKRSLYA
jgi:hypothetical protein